MVTVLFLELFIIIALLINIKFLLKTEKEKLATAVETEEVKANKLSWWDRFNKLSPVSEEADLDLGHDYDGIRELDNRLPPWWLYGFYLCIIFAGIYLWRFHVSHTGPSSKQEYERSVARADAKIQEYLKQKGESVDENTVTLLTSADDIQAGKLYLWILQNALPATEQMVAVMPLVLISQMITGSTEAVLKQSLRPLNMALIMV